MIEILSRSDPYIILISSEIHKVCTWCNSYFDVRGSTCSCTLKAVGIRRFPLQYSRWIRYDVLTTLRLAMTQCHTDKRPDFQRNSARVVKYHSIVALHESIMFMSSTRNTVGIMESTCRPVVMYCGCSSAVTWYIVIKWQCRAVETSDLTHTTPYCSKTQGWGGGREVHVRVLYE